MKKISLQWRITLMTVLLIGVTCVAMNLLLCSSGVYYMDKIADALQAAAIITASALRKIRKRPLRCSKKPPNSATLTACA